MTDDDINPSVEKYIESQGEMLHKADLLTPGEAREWIEETKEMIREMDADDVDLEEL